MNFILYISFSGLFLMQSMGSTMDLGSVLQKHPVFIEHYQEQAQHNGTSLVEFVDFHYGDEQDTQDHHHTDEHDNNGTKEVLASDR
ncbi:hypothetical protein U3A58_09170 [Algoriphagus sp. C2-6-M1]|uniref:hypothetical protein n=1 Tax=Algoriphagus persicinus TaxID=3108754 RepID=UPI002B36861B|nr:hypothetical protein [Algoriphagus sp. C2-6-M1]MEB2780564.1 hypothetical protein [Algoriphagus sp. C2-6-M1]